MRSPVLTTQRLVLRPLVPEDAEAITPLIGDIEVSKWLTVVPHPYSMQDALEFITSDGNRPGENWAITRNNIVVGVIGISESLGYWLGKPHWGLGIMTEAARAVVDDYFDDPEVTDLRSAHFIGNAGSKAILTDLGFQDIGDGQGHCRATGQEVEDRQMRLTRADWQLGRG